jgi:hypothetical protein
MVLMLSTPQLLIWTVFASLLTLLAYIAVTDTWFKRQGRFFTVIQVQQGMLCTFKQFVVPCLLLLLLLSFIWVFRPPQRVALQPDTKIERMAFDSRSIMLYKKPVRWPVDRSASRLTARQVECLALNMYHESRGELNKSVSLYGRQMNQAQLVAEVTLRRAHSTGRTICDTVYSDQQFSWTLGTVDVSEHLTYQSLLRAAEARLNAYRQGTRSPLPINHFYSHRVLKNPPDWASGMKVVAVVGSHTYLYSTNI